MTIHSSHPFASPEPERDPSRRFRGRIGGVVTLWTAGSDDRAGLTVSSVVVAGGEPPRVLALLDPDSDLAERLLETGLGLVHVLDWRHRDLADAFAGVAPAPGGPFRTADFVDHPHGPRLASAGAWAAVVLEETREVGWSLLVTCRIEEVVIREDDDGGADGAASPLLHLRGRYRRVDRAGGAGAH
ncbi:flavin reductase family protein [Nocardioides solisilvae]|uniref:flavin reductase family protein n=1 Tax=Nocardioides solisilvae TaxID=1542435 RepID=UPI000D74EB78|nr:flavin reductase family protein [Nocardioides solisilvae]